MMKKRIAACILAGVMGCSLLAGCSAEQKPVDGTQTVMTVADESATLGELALALRYQQAYSLDSYMSMMEAYGQTVSPGQTLWGETLNDDTIKQMQEDMKKKSFDTGLSLKTEADYLQVSISYLLAQQLAAVSHADEFDVSLSDEEKTEISETAKTFMENSDSKALELNGITQETVETYLSDFVIAQKVEMAYKEKQTVDIPDEDAQMMKVSVVAFGLNPDDEKLNEAKEVEAQAEAYRKELTAETDMSSVSETYANAKFGEDGLPVNAKDGDTVFSVEDVKAISQLKAGEVYDKVLKVENDTTTVWYVVRMVSPLDETMTEQQRQSLKNEKLSDMYDEQMTAWMKDGKVNCETQLIESLRVNDAVQYRGLEQDDEVKQEIVAGESTQNEAETDSGADTE